MCAKKAATVVKLAESLEAIKAERDEYKRVLSRVKRMLEEPGNTQHVIWQYVEDQRTENGLKI